MQRLVLAGMIAFVAIPAFSQEKLSPKDTEVWNPEPKKVDADAKGIPSDAIILFDGSSLTGWVSQKTGAPAEWEVKNGAMTVVDGKGSIQTKANFSDCQLHIEWKTPEQVVGTGQGRGNSGIFIQGLYEIQVLDSYQNRTYSNGQAGSVYKQRIPLVNAAKPPGEWQTYDIIWKAPRFDVNGILMSKARVTVIHNGVLVQNAVALDGPTVSIGLPAYQAHGAGPIVLQDHHNPVSFRNIWIRSL